MKWIGRGLITIIAVMVIIAAGGYFYLKGTLPQTSGDISVAGLNGKVVITRDKNGVPHIKGKTLDDAIFALGFVHAQDRLWQMEMNRRIGAGRLSEILGSATVGTDKFLRTLGVYHAAERTVQDLNDETRNSLTQYAKGVNAFLSHPETRLPVEFMILGVTPEKWTMADSVVWTKMMAWDLGANWSRELQRYLLSKKLSNRQISELFPAYPGDKLPDLPDFSALYAEADLPAKTIMAMAPEILPQGAGSNNWVVSGARSTTGMPLLANDPHLGLAVPALWYFAHIEAPGVNAIGATLPGVPAIILGRNQHIAWGFTNTAPDVQDLFIESTDDMDPQKYLTPTGSEPFKIRHEIIGIKDADDIKLAVRSSRHGPIISDVHKTMGASLSDGHVLSFAWTALRPEDKSAQAALKMMKATDWDSFKQAISNFNAPQQNMLYADIDGNIGYYAPALVPIRKPENDAHGLVPVPGWKARYDWNGYLPFDQLPQAFNPAKGYLMTANHKIVDSAYPHHITHEWTLPYRARRITELLEDTQKHSVKSFKKMHGDVQSRMVTDILPVILPTTPLDEPSAKALALLSGWTGEMTATDNAPLIFSAWIRSLNKHVYQDELAEHFEANWRLRPLFMENVLKDRNGQSRWCDDINSVQKENCADMLSLSLQTALEDLTARYGDDMSEWNWAEAHFAHSDHRPFSKVPFLQDLFDLKVPSIGGTYTINVGRNKISDSEHPFANYHAASLRAIYDLSDLNNSVFMHSTGQSGNLMSDFYSDMAENWSKIVYVSMSTDRSDYTKDSVGILTLNPG